MAQSEKLEVLTREVETLKIGGGGGGGASVGEEGRKDERIRELEIALERASAE